MYIIIYMVVYESPYLFMSQLTCINVYMYIYVLLCHMQLPSLVLLCKHFHYNVPNYESMEFKSIYVNIYQQWKFILSFFGERVLWR